MSASVLAFAAAALLPASAHAQNCMLGARASGGSKHSEIRDDDERLEVRLQRGGCELRVDARGGFDVNAKLDAFTRVGDGGFVELAERDGTRERKLRITSTGGRVRYRYQIDGDDGFDVDRERWLAGMLLAIERGTAMFAKLRVPELLKSGGPDAVLDETAHMSGDYARRTYLIALFKAAELSASEIDNVLAQTGTAMSSDFERAEVLCSVAKERKMSDRAANETIRVAATMSSDYEKRRVLSAALASVESPESTRALLEAAATFTSSYELATLLIDAQERSLIDARSADAYFKAIGRLTSDYERKRTLTSLLKKVPQSERIYAGVLDASTAMSSDFERAEVLIAFARAVPVRGELRDLYLASAKSITSDFEYRRTLEALLGDKNG